MQRDLDFNSFLNTQSDFAFWCEIRITWFDGRKKEIRCKPSVLSASAGIHHPVRKVATNNELKQLRILELAGCWKLGPWCRLVAHRDLFQFKESCMTLWHDLWQFGNRVRAHKHHPKGEEAGRCCKKANGSITVLEPVLRKRAHTPPQLGWNSSSDGSNVQAVLTGSMS